MLWKFTNTNKYGNLRSRVVYADGALKIGRGFGSFQAAQRFRYESRSPYFGLMVLPADGKKYLTPDWIEVHPQTTYNDIVHNAPEVVEAPVQKNEWIFESSSGDGFYKVRQNGLKLTCTCPGSWRAADRRCKHIKAVEKELCVK
jgi:hypothetical protein